MGLAKKNEHITLYKLISLITHLLCVDRRERTVEIPDNLVGEIRAGGDGTHSYKKNSKIREEKKKKRDR